MRMSITLSALAFLFALLGSSTLAIPYVHANHPSGNHQEAIHFEGDKERICVDTKNSSDWTHSAAKDVIRDALIYNEAYGEWDGLANDKIYFTFDSDQCSSQTSSDLSNVEMRVYVMDDTNAKCDGPYSCVYHYDYQRSHDGYNDYRYEKVYIRSQDLTNIPRGIVNHEFGHTLGLRDGYDSPCPGSIMHYSCNYPEGPTSKDQDSVENLANLTP